MYLLILIFGFCVSTVQTQQLTTKCLNADWTQYYEKCYLAVNYTFTWTSARDYCGKYGAKLVEPRGYELNDMIHEEVLLKMPSVSSYWTGYNRIVQAGNSALPAYLGYWSDEQTAGVEMGVWGLRQPDISAGDCAYVDNNNKFWYMTSCDMLMPFLCEMDPCPADDRDTFMCNGRCLGLGLQCDGIDDCGNNLDEQNCASSCSETLESNSGTITPPTSSQGLYLPSSSCTWLIHTQPGTRINMEVVYLNTEENTDFLEIYDGCMGLSDGCSLAVRLSGDMNNYQYRSSLNFAFIRFVSDLSTEDRGFELTWTTEYVCEYTQLTNYRFSNTEIVYDRLNLTSASTVLKCQTECDENSDCVGFSFDNVIGTGRCQFFNMLPILQEDTSSSIYINSCSGYGTVQGSVLLWNSMLTATDSYQQLATPNFPNYYIGNMDLEYKITASANNRITLEILTIDLCCGDTITIHDEDRSVLYTLASDSVPSILVSTSNTVYVRMNLNTHWKCNGILLYYRQGCDITLMGSGQFLSPGYGSSTGYGPLTVCTWTVNAPSTNRSVSVLFEDFDLHFSDSVKLTYSNGTVTSHNGTSLNGQSFTSTTALQVTLETSARDTGAGFLASFSPGCTSLLSADGYRVLSGSSNYGDTLMVECEDGYSFTGQQTGQLSVTMTCGPGGIWSVDPVPVCERSYCGPPMMIDNGYIVTSTGSQGGDTTEYVCAEGYMLTGSDIISCLANASWENPPTCIGTPCEDLDTTLTDIDVQVLYGSGTDYNSVVRLSCSPYTEVIGAATVSCQNGSWSYTEDVSPSFCRAEPCETPIIDHGFLTPSPPYTVDMTISVTCIEGYELDGDGSFQCGVDMDLPVCVAKTCSLDGFPDVQTVGSIQTLYNYGEIAQVTCAPGLRLTNVQSTTLNIECLADGSWSFIPVCQNASCGIPYQVPGSVYVPAVPCLDYFCEFEFQCALGYERVGTSDYRADPSQTQGDTVVRCGAINNIPGLWDFGDLHCIGGQCPDPGYPGSGYLIGESFEEGAVITFGCSDTGFEPLNADGTEFTGLVCNRSETTGELSWVGDVPTCEDVQSPTFENCPTNIFEISNLEAPGFVRPSVRDNNAVKMFKVSPENFDPYLPLTEATNVFYQAQDYNGNSALCRVTVVIPDTFVCKNDIASNYLIDSDVTIFANNPDFFELKDRNPDIELIFVPPSVMVTAEASTLEEIQEIAVTASLSNETIDTCTLQFQFRAPACASWSLYVPNGFGNCNNGACAATCSDGSYFMEDPSADNITVTCAGTDWNREPPVCAIGTTSYVIYSTIYNIRYLIADGVSDFGVCTDAYRAEIEEKLISFANETENLCNEFSGDNHIIVTFMEVLNLEYDSSTTRLDVRFEYQINVTDESASNSQELKDQCANTILTYLMDPLVQRPISNLEGGVPASGCSSGIYISASNTPSFSYRCISFRKFVNINGKRLCLDCPIGYFYNITQDNCVKCPVGRYGSYLTDQGSVCEACPNGAGPDKTGLTDVDQCFLKGRCQPGYYSTDGLEPCTICPKNFYSEDELSRTCQACLGNQVTLQEGAKFANNCLSQVRAEEEGLLQGIETPCDPDPCQNGANCTYVYNTFNCSCAAGFTGRYCETQLTACSSNPCKNDQPCRLNIDGSFYCECDFEFSDPEDNNNNNETYLCEIDFFGCDASFCGNNGTCHNARGSYSCKCPSYAGFSNLGTGNCGTPVDHCTANPCVQGTCIEHGTFYRSCLCYPGYTGLDCRTNLDDCNPNLCQNGATCADGIDGFTCECATGFHGDFCQFSTSCDRKCGGLFNGSCNTCDDTGTDTCHNVGNSYVCNCRANYTGLSCEIQLSPCNSYPCQHNGTCLQVTDTEFNCECKEPWTGDNCETEIDNCNTGTECLNGGTCYSTSSGYVCGCSSSYIGSNCGESYDLCARASPCVDSICDFVDGQFNCECQEGFSQESCQIRAPSCSDMICNNGGTCSDDSGSPVCVCVDGYSGTTCDENINDCAQNPCSPVQECQDGVNTYTCTCITERRGENCDKVVDGYFDYIIIPSSQCREDASRTVFGDGQTDVEAITISFWARYTALHGSGTIMRVFATNQNVEQIPESPELSISFDATSTVAQFTTPDKRRKKRATETTDFSYRVNIADGYWWHIVLVWSSQTGELTLYINGTLIEQEFFAVGSTLGTRGFLVIGDFDPVTGSSDTTNSFEGKISQLFVVGEALDITDVQSLFGRNLAPSNILLYPQRTTMLYYAIDYNSELTSDNPQCLSRTDAFCDINTETSLPVVTQCPEDVLSVTERLEAPTWTAPIFFGDPPYISTLSSGTLIDWGVYGVSYAVFDEQNNSAVCTFRVYNREVRCTPSNGSATCVIDNSVYRCESSCGTNQEWSGVVPLYLTCSLYGMWDEAVKTSTYIQPSCSAATPVTSDVTLELTTATSVPCSTIQTEYISSIRTKLNTFNTQIGNALCPVTCDALVTSSTVTCLDDYTAMASISFGLTGQTVPYQSSTINVEEALQIAIGDSEVFSYASTSNSNATVEPDISSVDIMTTPQCTSDYQISGDSCVQCGLGTSYDVSTSTCVRCPRGTYRQTLSSSTCTLCHTSQTTETDGATSSAYCQTNCFLGQYFDSADVQGCRDCPVGFYQDVRGEFICKACLVSYTTVEAGSQSVSDCVTFASLTTTPSQVPIGLNIGASTEDSGLETGVIVAIVFAVLIGLLIIILILVFCCCKGAIPCLSKKKQVVSPATKESYYANKYGELDMRFVSYNLQDVREKKGRPLDKEPIYEPPLSDDTGSLRTDISIHVPVFNEKMNGSITKKSLYMSNGGQNLNASLTRSQRSTAREHGPPHDQMSPRIIAPLTSSPRSINPYNQYENVEEMDHYRKPKSKKRKRKSDRHRSHRHHDNTGEDQYEDNLEVAHLPKALSPLPQKVKSLPPSNVFMRPASPMTRPRTEIQPSHYEDILDYSPERPSGRSRGERTHPTPPKPQKVHRIPDPSEPHAMMRIEVESDEDLR